MKIRRLMGAMVLSCAGSAMWATPTAIAGDTIERSCKAMYGLYMPGTVTDMGVRMQTIDEHTVLDHSYDFSARRGCGRTVPNRCRQRASEAAMQCMVAHSNAPKTTPVACTSNGVDDYRITNLEQPVQEAVCRHVKGFFGAKLAKMPNPLLVTTSVKAFVDGDDGCGGGNEKHLMKYVAALTISCPREQ